MESKLSGLNIKLTARKYKNQVKISNLYMLIKSLLRKILSGYLSRLNDENHHSLEHRLQRLEQVIEITNYPHKLNNFDNFKPSAAYKFCDWFVNLFRKPGRKKINSYLMGMTLYVIASASLLTLLFVMYTKYENNFWSRVINVCNFIGKHYINIFILILSSMIICAYLKKSQYAKVYIDRIVKMFKDFIFILIYVGSCIAILTQIGNIVCSILHAYSLDISDGVQRFNFEENKNAIVSLSFLAAIVVIYVSTNLLISLYKGKDVKWSTYQINSISLFKFVILFIIIFFDLFNKNTLNANEISDQSIKVYQYIEGRYIARFFILCSLTTIIELIWAEYEIDKAILTNTW